MSTVLHIQNGEVGYIKPLISDVNLKLEAGKLYCLVGENGSGKSTLLKSILQDIPFLKGQVDLFGRPIFNYTIKEIAQKVSVVYTGRISTDLTVNEVIELGRQPYTGFLGKLKKADCTIIEKAISQTNIEALRTKKTEELSDGQYQKVMLTRALVQDTPLLLLDEPTSFLDPNNKVQLLELLQKIVADSNKAILFSSHDIELAKRFSDEFLLVNDSGIEQIPVESKELDMRFKKVFHTF